MKLDLSRLSLETLLMDTIEHRSYELLSKVRDRLSLQFGIEVIVIQYIVLY